MPFPKEGGGPRDAALDVNGDEPLVPDGGPLDRVGGAGTFDSGTESRNFGIDAAHTNAQPNDRVSSPLRQKWATTLLYPSDPIVAGGSVFVTLNEDAVAALDSATGKIVWQQATGIGTRWLAYDSGAIYALDYNGNLTAFAADTGMLRFSVNMQPQWAFFSAPVAISGIVYVTGGGNGGTIYAFDGTTGNLRWSVNTRDAIDAAPAVVDGLMYEVGGLGGCLDVSAFDALTGVNTWQFGGLSCAAGGNQTVSVYDGRVWAHGSLSAAVISISDRSSASFAADVMPSFHEGTAFYVSSTSLRAVSIVAGSEKWSFAGDGELCTPATIAGVGGQVFVGSAHGPIYELDESSGKLKSKDNTGELSNCGPMAIAAGHLFVSTNSALIAY